MSFDLYFVDVRAGSTFDDAMAAFEEAAELEEPFTAEHATVWGRIEQRVRAILPEAELFTGTRNREVTDLTTGIQLAMYPGEISITVPYWYDGDGADPIVATLQSLARAVEEVTGLTAYDPQADAAFLEDGDARAPGVFQQIADAFVDEGRTSAGHAPTTPTPRAPSRRSRFLKRNR